MPGKKILLVDGYNIINRVPALKARLEAGLESARTALALQVSAWGRSHLAYECIIVFDGDKRYSGGREQRLAGVRCIFSRSSHGGDDELIRIVRDHKGDRTGITVVSDDNKVGNSCRAHGASVRPSNHILGEKARPAGRSKRAPANDKVIDRKAAAEIDREFRKKFGI